MLRFLVFVLLALPFPAWANDSTAALVGGGLVLTKTDEIAMESEALTITPDLISVNYQFQNTSDAPITTRVAFPLPDLSLWDAFYEHQAFPVSDPMNFVGFSTQIDGKPVPMERSIRMMAGKKDVTDAFLSFGFVRSLADPSLFKKIDNEPALAKLKQIGVGMEENQNDVVQKTAYHWEQTFPAKKTLSVAHRYGPVPGIQILYPSLLPTFLGKHWKESFCLDASSATALRESLGGASRYPVRTVRYVLTTGNNWKGGIGQFRLRVEAKPPFEAALFCSPDGAGGLVGKSLEINLKNFSPKQELNILFIGKENDK